MLALAQLIIRIIIAVSLSMAAALGVYSTLPQQARVDVPFTAQAPDGIWTEPWQNACEEASIIMINNFYRGSTGVLTPDAARREILEVFAAKEAQLGPSADESMQTVASIINGSRLNWTARVVTDPTIEEMKTELAENRPIIAPVHAPELNNPFYTGTGPEYHVVVMIGYDDATGAFITHDPGTAQGENFQYPYELFYQAISDFLDTTDDRRGPRRVLYTRPEASPSNQNTSG